MKKNVKLRARFLEAKANSSMDSNRSKTLPVSVMSSFCIYLQTPICISIYTLLTIMAIIISLHL